jgi:hypothetical protein
MAETFYHATLNDYLGSIFKNGLVPNVGAFTEAAHSQPCPIHPDVKRVHLTRSHLDSALFSALCFHVIRKIQSKLRFDDDYLVAHCEPGWLQANDIAAFGALVEVETDPDTATFQGPRDSDCTCLEEGDIFLTQPVPIKRYWTLARLFSVLNADATVETFRQWLESDHSDKKRMNDGIFLFEFRPDALAQPCPNAEQLLAPLRSQYPAVVTDLDALKRTASAGS